MVSSQVGSPLITFQMHFITRTQYLHTTNLHTLNIQKADKCVSFPPKVSFIPTVT